MPMQRIDRMMKGHKLLRLINVESLVNAFCAAHTQS